MTAEEQTAFEAESAQVAGALQSPWEPACIARAFASRSLGTLDFTMQVWIDLEAIRSPLLLGVLPETAEEFACAAAIFGCEIAELSAEEMADLGGAMRRAIAEAFAMNVAMTPPKSEPAEGGFGTWLPIFEALLGECGMSRVGALETPVGQAYAILAARRRREGWTAGGEVYAFREAAEPEKEEADV